MNGRQSTGANLANARRLTALEDVPRCNRTLLCESPAFARSTIHNLCYLEPKHQLCGECSRRCDGLSKILATRHDRFRQKCLIFPDTNELIGVLASMRRPLPRGVEHMKKQPIGIGMVALAGGLLLAGLYPAPPAASADVAETREQRDARIYLEVLHSDIAKMKAHGIDMEEASR